MLYFLIWILVQGLTIAITAWLVPGIHVVENYLWTYILLSAGIGLLNAVVRPLILLLTGRYVIITMGVLLLVINAFMLWLLGLLFPSFLVVDGLFAALVGGAIMALVGTVLQTVVGLGRPIVEVTEQQAPPRWYGLDRMYYGERNPLVENLRIQQVYDTIWRYGLDIAIDSTPLADFRRGVQDRIYRVTGREQLSTPAKVRLMLQELGPIYVKMGQIISSQSQTLPADWLAEMSKLQNNVPPFRHCAGSCHP